MIQQINLYQLEFRKVSNWISLSFFAGVGLMVLILLASSFYQALSLDDLETELSARNSELNSLEQSYQALQKTVQPRAIDMNLAERVLKVKRSNEEKIRAKNYLSGDGAGNLTGFSSLLQGLGRQRDKIEELWLKKIQFSDGGYDMRLYGSNYQAELLPEFIQALNEEDLYKDREFRQIKINRSTQDKKIIDFELATRNKEDSVGLKSNRLDVALFMARLKRISEAGYTQ